MPVKPSTARFTEADLALCYAEYITTDDFKRLEHMAHKGHSAALLMLGHVLAGAVPSDVPTEPRLAIVYYQNAAVAGQPEGMLFFARSLLDLNVPDIGISTDLTRLDICVEWLEKAANRHEMAEARLDLYKLCYKWPAYATNRNIPPEYLRKQLQLAAETIQEAKDLLAEHTI